MEKKKKGQGAQEQETDPRRIELVSRAGELYLYRDNLSIELDAVNRQIAHVKQEINQLTPSAEEGGAESEAK